MSSKPTLQYEMKYSPLAVSQEELLDLPTRVRNLARNKFICKSSWQYDMTLKCIYKQSLLPWSFKLYWTNAVDVLIIIHKILAFLF